MKVDDKLIERLEDISRLRLKGDEREAVMESLAGILAYAEKLGELDTGGVEEVTHPLADTNRFRDDVASNGDCRDLLLKNTKNKDGCFIAPRTVE